MSPTATAARRNRTGIAPERANRLAATFAAGAARPAPPMDDEPAVVPIVDPTSSITMLLQAVPDVTVLPTPAEPEPQAPEAVAESVEAVTEPVQAVAEPVQAVADLVEAGAAESSGPPGSVPRPARSSRTTPTKAVAPAPSAVRVKQTVELPEDVYERVQDFARGHRTSFQVLIRALVDDLLSGEDHKHRARLAGLIEVAEQEKRARKRRCG